MSSHRENTLMGTYDHTSSPEPGLSRSLHRLDVARNTHRPMDIPGAATSPFMELGSFNTSDGGDEGVFLVGSNHRSTHAFSYGTSPGGHGMGYLMRSRRRNSRQESRDLFLHHALHSHDELGELAQDAVLADDLEHGSLQDHVGSPYAPISEDPKSFSYNQADLTAPLLPPLRSAPTTTTAAAGTTGTAATPTPTNIASSRATPRSTEVIRAIVFGLINATAGIPALVAYAAIVFRHPSYSPYLDLLCKFFFLSSAIHQTIFCLISTLPFAMGQVQDVGIIFLSAMSTSIAGLALDSGRSAADALGTSLLTMTLSTFVVGMGTWLVAHKSLASFVKYIPLPVMGGYLAFVGYFCIASGVGLGVNVEIGTVASWAGLFDRMPLIKLIPTVASTVAMVLTLEKCEHPLALPAVLIGVVGVFHLVLLVTGISLGQAQEGGWVMPPAAQKVEFWRLWELYNFKDWKLSGIFFPAIWRQAAKTAGLLLVVIFGSCMDIAAIQQDVPYKIDFNRELTTVAISNMATGVVGVGFTGSYIFSQTVFTMRAGVNSRINGWVIAGTEFLVFALPYSIVQYLPNYFLGALLLWFGVEISRDWLILSYFKLTLVEYGLLWLTFSSIMQWGLEGGIAAGIVFSTLLFAYAYAQSQVQNFQASNARSLVVRTVEHHAALDLLWSSHATTAQLQGFIFFGSAQSMGAKLHEAATRLVGHWGDTPQEERIRLEEAILSSAKTTGEDYSGAKHDQALAALSIAPKFLIIDLSKVTGMDSSGARTLAETIRDLGVLGMTAILTGAGHHGIMELLQMHDVRIKGMRWPPELCPPPPPPEASPLDVAAAHDWGAHTGEAQGALLAGEGRPRQHLGVSPNPLIRAGEGGGMTVQTIEHRTPNQEAIQIQVEGHDHEHGNQHLTQQEYQSGAEEEPEAFSFPTLQEGLRFCEDALLEVGVQFGLCTPPGAGTTLKELLASHLEKLPLTSPNNAEAMASTLRRYMKHKTVRRGEVLWQPDDPANELFLVERGVIRVDQLVPIDTEEEEEVERGGGGGGGDGSVQRYALPSVKKIRSFELGPGCVAGSTDFYLARPHGTRAVCASVACRILRLSRTAMARMAVEAPAALNVLQMAIMRANSSDLSTAADAVAALH